MPDKECISRKKFIRLGAAVGLGAAAVPLVSACGGDGGSVGSGGPPKASDVVEGGPKVGKGQAIAKESEVKPGSAFPFTDADTGQQSVLVGLEDGELVAYPPSARTRPAWSPTRTASWPAPATARSSTPPKAPPS